MLRAMPTASAHVKLTAIVAAIAFVVVGILFYVLSIGYFESHHQMVPGQGMVPLFLPDQIMTIRLTYLLFSAIIAVGSVAAQKWPRAIGHGIPTVFGVVYIVAAIAALVHGGVTTALPASL